VITVVLTTVITTATTKRTNFCVEWLLNKISSCFLWQEQVLKLLLDRNNQNTNNDNGKQLAVTWTNCCDGGGGCWRSVRIIGKLPVFVPKRPFAWAEEEEESVCRSRSKKKSIWIGDRWLVGWLQQFAAPFAW
jgi:hypothetical protein